MQPQDEQKLLESLYDRLFDAITYSPDGKESGWQRDTTFLQLAKNTVLNEEDFENMFNPTNPHGDFGKAELFSAMVDTLPNPEAEWTDSGRTLSDTYATIVNNANTSITTDPDQLHTYNLAFNFLNVNKTTTDFTGNSVTTIEPSQIAIAYDNAQAAYITALGGYRVAYNSYDLTKTDDQRAWNAVAPGLQLTLDQAWNNWVRNGKAQVEQAQNALVSTINNAVSDVIAKSQTSINPQHQMASVTTGGRPWLPSYAIPTNWYDATLRGAQLTLKSDYLNRTSSEKATSFTAAASYDKGMFHVSGEASGEFQNNHSHMDANNFELQAELITVDIKRPWYNPLLFGMNSWYVDGFSKDGISDGSQDLNGMMPIVPTGFVVARNVRITADFSSEDQSLITSSISAKASAGIGPFSFSGSYSHSSRKEKFTSSFDGSTLTLPGLQIIGWINTILPACPPQNSSSPNN